MKRLIAIFLILALILPLSTVNASVPYQTNIAISVGKTETERNFVWYSLSSQPGVLQLWILWEPLEYLGSYYATVSKASDGDYYIHRVTVENLLPDIDYGYQLINEDVKSPFYHFSTSATGDFSFIFAGDPQLGESKDTSKDRAGWALALNRIAYHEAFTDSAFLLTAGDHVDEKNNEDHFDDLLEHAALKSIPMANVIGNHEAKSEIFSQHFFRPNDSTTYGVTKAGGDAYFLFNDVLFFLINSNDRDTEEHRAFMEEVLAEHPDTLWQVVALHHSLYTVANHAYDESILARREELVPLFAELGIDVVLSGHDHVYCRSYLMDSMVPLSHWDYYDEPSRHSATNTHGIVYVTANSSSGSKTYDPREEDFPYSAEHHQYDAGELSRIDITENSFSIRTFRTDTMEEVDRFTLYRTEEAPHAFTDVSPTDWYDRAVQYTFSHGLMKGTGEEVFSPTLPTTRAMAVTLLHRMEGSPETGTHSFTDVVETAYYNKAVAWAVEAGIVTGVSPELFAADRPITREQLVTMLARYASYCGMYTEAEDLAESFVDADLVSAYARASVNWALAEGLLQGTGKDRLSPQGTATRAQVAQIFMRIDKMF
ncbi:MAG: S-layer homology domain-containing protein [Oscillospiraceae bacterium]|nr:S-layer homology domain-containing protein [Oscillospiraceae bacterium]